MPNSKLWSIIQSGLKEMADNKSYIFLVMT